MRRWQVWFFGRSGQALLWITVIVAGWLLLTNPGSARARKPLIIAAPSASV